MKDVEFYAKKDYLVVAVYIILLAAITTLSFFVKKHFAFIVFLVFFVALFVVFTASVVKTKYVFKENYLFVKSGFLRKKIYYLSISNIKKCKSIRFSLCLSVQRIRLRAGKNFMFDQFVAPILEDEFIYELEKRIDNAKTFGGVWWKLF